jgi:hypothetical protein
MRVIVAIALGLLAGCASGPTLEQLEAQAFATGDWSAVEKRERRLQQRDKRQGITCPYGQISYCESFAGVDRCGCLSRRNAYSLVGQHFSRR